MIQVTVRLPHLTRRHTLLGAAGLSLAVLLAVGAIGYLHIHSALIGLPATSYRDLTFPVYYPHPIPPDFRIDPASISSTSQVLTYKFDYQAKAPLIVSIQPLDPALDLSSFRPTREISTAIGHGYLVEYEERTTVAIVTSKSFVLLNAPQKIPGAAIEQFASSLQPAK